MELKTKKIDLLKLKVKAKSLAEEARIIRKEEKAVLKDHGTGHIFENCSGILNSLYGEPDRNQCLWYEDLHRHRVIDVRREARATHLAIAFLKGMSYNKVESKTHDPLFRDTIILGRVANMVLRYGYHRNPQYVSKEFREAVKQDVIKWWTKS